MPVSKTSHKFFYMLNVNRLRKLREVAARGTIAAAAEALFMTPSAVSQQMAVLEREAGVPLLERSGRGVRLTAAGERLVANTEAVLAALERAEADLIDASRGIVGHVRVSAFPSAARGVLIPALVELRRAHPNLTLSTVDLEPEEALPALKARQLDVVMTYEWNLLPTLSDPGIARERLFAEPVQLALPSGHRHAGRPGDRVPLGALANDEWIVGRDSTSMLGIVEAAARAAGFSPLTPFHSMDIDVILAAVRAGLGVALVPPLAIPEHTPGVEIRGVADLELVRTIWVAVRRGSEGNPAIAAVLACLREHAGMAARAIAERWGEPSV